VQVLESLWHTLTKQVKTQSGEVPALRATLEEVGNWHVLAKDLVFVEEETKLHNRVVALDEDMEGKCDSKGCGLVCKEVGGYKCSDCVQRCGTGVLLSVGAGFKTHELTHQNLPPTYGGW
jgi:hypothetical protein